MPPTAREAIRIVERDGWFHVETKGGHRQFRHPIKPGRVTIPGPLGKELKKWIWNSILRQSGLR